MDFGGLAFLSTSAISVLRVSAVFLSSLQAVASVAAMMSLKGIFLGAIAKDNPSVSTSSSIAVSCLWLRFINSLRCSSVGCDGPPWNTHTKMVDCMRYTHASTASFDLFQKLAHASY